MDFPVLFEFIKEYNKLKDGVNLARTITSHLFYHGSGLFEAILELDLAQDEPYDFAKDIDRMMAVVEAMKEWYLAPHTLHTEESKKVADYFGIKT